MNVRKEIILCLDGRTVTSLSNLGVIHEVEENTASYDDDPSGRDVVKNALVQSVLRHGLRLVEFFFH